MFLSECYFRLHTSLLLCQRRNRKNFLTVLSLIYHNNKTFGFLVSFVSSSYSYSNFGYIISYKTHSAHSQRNFFWCIGLSFSFSLSPYSRLRVRTVQSEGSGRIGQQLKHVMQHVEHARIAPIHDPVCPPQRLLAQHSCKFEKGIGTIFFVSINCYELT